MGPLSCVAAQIVRFTDEPVVSISWVPPEFSGGGGATDNNKTNLRSSPASKVMRAHLYILN